MKKGILKLDKNGKIWRQYRKGAHDKGMVKIKSRKTGHITADGYNRIALWYNNKNHFFCVHRVIWVYHNGKIAEGMVINHIDGNKTNNRIKNLEAVTRSGNCIHRLKK